MACRSGQNSTDEPGAMGLFNGFRMTNFLNSTHSFLGNGGTSKSSTGDSEILIDEAIKYIENKQLDDVPSLQSSGLSIFEPYSGMETDLLLYGDLPEKYERDHGEVDFNTTGKLVKRPLRDVLIERHRNYSHGSVNREAT